MRIGIVVHSDTGNTRQAADLLATKLKKKGHSVTVEQLDVVQEKAGDPNAKPAAIPDVSNYEGLVLAAPVHAFHLSIAMRKTLADIGSLEGKPVAVLVTQGLPMKWMGGNNALRKMASLAKAKGAQVQGRGSVNWPKKDVLIEPVTDQLASLF